MRTESASPILIALLLAGCGGKDIVFSSRTSPNGSMVAENVLVDDNFATGGTGYLIIRNVHAETGYYEALDEPAADLFMRWIDDSHLEVRRERQGREGKVCEPPMPKMMGDVHIVCKSYDPRPRIPAEKIAVPAGNVSVAFDRRSTENGTSCVLSIETEQASYDSAKLQISVDVSNSCKTNRDRPCADVSTRFNLGDRHATVPQTMLTSATIDDIAGNRFAVGGEGTMVGGSLGGSGEAVAALIEHLKKPSIQIEYSRDFFDQVLTYDVPLTGHAKTLGEFDACVSDADLLWVQHER
jgi:hypothetical protein